MSVSPTTAITCPTRDVRASPPSAMIYIGTKPSPGSVCLVCVGVYFVLVELASFPFVLNGEK
jgi:hypothetical protein